MKRTLILGGLTAITSAALIGGAASVFADTGNAGRAHTTICDGGSWLTPGGPGKIATGPVKVVDGSVLTPGDPVLTPADPVLAPADPVLTPVKGKPSHVRRGHAHPVGKPVSGGNCGTTR